MSQPPGPGPYEGPPPPHHQPQQPQPEPPATPYGYPRQQPPAYPQQPGYGQGAPYGQVPHGQPQPGPGGYPGGYPPQAGYQPPYGYPQGNLPGMPPLASWGARLGALLLDSLIFMLIPTGLIGAGYGQLAKRLIDRKDDCDRLNIPDSSCPVPNAPGSAVALIVVGVVLSLAIGLFLSHREGSTGQTLGKKIVGIRLLREYDGSTLGFGLAFGRRLLHVVDYLSCGIGYLWPLWDHKRQTFADKMVHTVVIRD